MELNALTRWESIGKDLYARGKLGSEIERIKQFSKMLSAARKKQRQSGSSGGSGHSRTHSAQQPDDEPQQVSGLVSASRAEDSRLGGIAESAEDEGEAVDEADGDEQLNDVSPLPLLDAIEAAEAEAANKQQDKEERMQDDIEEKELDSIPPTHARVSSHCISAHAPHAALRCIRTTHSMLLTALPCTRDPPCRLFPVLCLPPNVCVCVSCVCSSSCCTFCTAPSVASVRAS